MSREKFQSLAQLLEDHLPIIVYLLLSLVTGNRIIASKILKY